MIIGIPDENSIIKWKYKDADEWKIAEISDLIKAYERPQGEWICITEGNLGINTYKCSLCGHWITCTEGAMKQHKGCYCGAVMGDGSEGQ